MNLKIINLSKKARPKKKKVYNVWSHLYKILKNIILGIVSKSRFIVSWRGCGWNCGIQECIKKFGEMIEIFIILIVVIDSQMYIYIKTHHTFNMYGLFWSCILQKICKKTTTQKTGTTNKWYQKRSSAQNLSPRNSDLFVLV